jgi:hypothetical protein
MDKEKAIDDLKKFHGIPPYDGCNPCQGDGYFAMDIEKRFKMSIAELEKAVGFKEIINKWKAARQNFLN